MMQDSILVFDFGGQYCHLIARRVRESNVYSEIVSGEISKQELNGIRSRLNVKGIILSGGPSSIYEKGAPRLDRGVIESGIPILGICYGHQLLASSMSGRVVPAKKMEYGIAQANVNSRSDLFKGSRGKEQVWMSHGDTVIKAPKSAKILASTPNCPVAAFGDEKGKIYGVQWHPEVMHTPNGGLILNNFIFGICHVKRDWNVTNDLGRYVNEITERIGNNKAIIALSGGIDSTTAGAIAAKAMGKNLTAVFVDHGFMREGESDQITAIAKKLGMRFIRVEAKSRFMRHLKGVSDPEQKRKIIGREFIRVFEEEARKSGADYLIQGTIYPDRIESGHSKRSKVIKTHHNVGGLPVDIKFKGVVEPLRDLYKDEVRAVAAKLGLPTAMIRRQPFPGPGLAVRIISDIDEKKLDIVRKADHIVTEELERSEMKELPWQYFAVLTDTMSTGVKGDSRSYGSVIAIRAIGSKDAMTASFSKIPYDVLERISTRITNEISDVVRVVYDVTNKPPSTIEWE
jgi:GMP synthase (glutamine-hydrolysing)